MFLTTVEQVIIACLDFRDFVILKLFGKSKIRELSISMISIIISFVRLLNSRIPKPRSHRTKTKLLSLAINGCKIIV